MLNGVSLKCCNYIDVSKLKVDLSEVRSKVIRRVSLGWSSPIDLLFYTYGTFPSSDDLRKFGGIYQSSLQYLFMILYIYKNENVLLIFSENKCNIC